MKTDSPIVSLCIPIYNVETYIERSVRSALEQTYENLEFILVDDCSTDKTIEILEKTLLAYPERENRIKLINHTSNRGVAAARNTALDNANGDFIVWMDSDDYVEKEMVQKLVDIALKSNASIVISGVCKLFKDKNEVFLPKHITTPNECIISLLKHEIGNGLIATLFDRSLYEYEGVRCIEGCNHGEDMFLKLRCFYYADSVAYIDEALYYYDCTRSDSLTSYHGIIDEERIDDAWRQWNQNVKFLSEKGNSFYEALQTAEFTLALNLLISCAHSRQSLHLIDSIYKEHLNKLPSKLWKQIPVMKVIPRYINNKWFLYFYFTSLAWIKHDVLRKGKR